MLEFENRCESAGRWIEACERQVGKASAGDANILLEKRWCPLAFRCRQSLMLAELASFWMQVFRKGYTGRSD
jgi:hypothetical protein